VGLRRRYYKAVKAAGVRRLAFHELRHTFGTHAVRKLDGYAVQSYMGHAHYSTTQRYLHHKPRREDAQKLADAFSISPGHRPERATQDCAGPKTAPGSDWPGVLGTERGACPEG
jgi:hypothetical protein